MVVIASIHQPSTSTFLLFDNILLLSEGKTVYFGPPSGSTQYFSEHGHPPEPFMSPAESILHLVNVEFSHEEHEQHRVNELAKAWEGSSQRKCLLDKISRGENERICSVAENAVPTDYPRSLVMQTWIQLHRTALVFILVYNLIVEIVSGFTGVWCSYCYVSLSRYLDGDDLVTFSLYARKYSKLFDGIILW